MEILRKGKLEIVIRTFFDSLGKFGNFLDLSFLFLDYFLEALFWMPEP